MNQELKFKYQIRAILLTIISLSLISVVYREQQYEQQQHQIRSLKNVVLRPYKQLNFMEIDIRPKSRVSCMLETFNESASSPGALLRSCEYEFLCYDVNKNQFVIFPSVNHYKVLSRIHSSIYLSSISKPIVASTTSASTQDVKFIRPIYAKFKKKDKHYIIDEDIKETVWIPLIISESFKSVLWDIYFPIFSLLEMFYMTSKSFQIFLLNDNNVTLKRIYDFSEKMQLPRPNIISASPNATFGNFNAKEYLCFPHVVMGIGGHGYNLIPRPRDPAKEHQLPPEHMHRGDAIQKFRNYLIQQMHISAQNLSSIDLVYSTQASWVKMLDNYTYVLMEELKQSMSLREKVSMILQTKILLLTSEEDKTVALFLPPKAHLIVLGLPKLDWDFWTNCIWIYSHNIQVNISESIAYIVDEAMHDRVLQRDTIKMEKESMTKVNYNHNVSLVYHPPPVTRIHCVAEKLVPSKSGAPHFRSCLFENLCYDMTKKKFLIFPSPAYLKLLTQQNYLLQLGNYFSTVASSLVVSPSMKSTTDASYGTFKVHTVGEIGTKYYRFNGTWISLDSAVACNPGHLMWDFWAPVYALQDRFGIIENSLLLMYGTNRKKCNLPIRKRIEQLFKVGEAKVPAMKFQIQNPESNYICSDYSTSGYGWLNDHGFGSHGWIDKEMEYPMNLHRGPEYSRLRDFMLKNINLQHDYKPRAPFIILFSQESSRDVRRCLRFTEEIQIATHLQNQSNGLISVHSFHHENTTFRKQLEMSSKASVFITASGGGSFPAFFLPKGSVLIIYGDQNMHLDSDVYNNYGQIRVHWMSLHSKDNDSSIFFHLLCDEIENLLIKTNTTTAADCKRGIIESEGAL